MNIRELPVKTFLEHLRRHPVPELIDEKCMEALRTVEEQYGDTVSHGTGLEIRLGSPERYADYVMNIDTDSIPGISSLWYEIDYGEFRRAGEQKDAIVPCLFANIPDGATGSARMWDEILPPFMGEKRARILRPALDRVLARLPEGATVKQIGTMSSRGELDIMRLVVLFPSWEDVFPGLATIGWQGDTDALREALRPWRETNMIAVNIDLGAEGVLEKIGVEVFSKWRNPVLADRYIARMEEAGLCLPSKAEALRRWTRFRPDGDPFIQTLIAYFKLNYRNGRITEAKAYLEQTPYPHHHYYDAYDRPVRLDLELAGKTGTMEPEKAREALEAFARERGRLVRLYGAERYPESGQVLKLCAALSLKTETVLPYRKYDSIPPLAAAGAEEFLIDLDGEQGVPDLFPLNMTDCSGKPVIRARWFMSRKNASALEQVIEAAEATEWAELIVTAARPGTDREAPDCEQAGQAAETIRRAQRERKITLTAESCFSSLRAHLGGEDPRRNPNRGTERGCEAGRSFLAVRADGTPTPCLFLDEQGERTGAANLAEYWTGSLYLRKLRERSADTGDCAGCPYSMRCLPCPASGRN